MKRIRFVPALLLLAACASTTPPPSRPPIAPVTRPANALTPAATLARTITTPSIRVGLLGDQSAVTFPRTTDGYYVITDAGASVIKRGFTLNAPAAGAPVRYAVQASAISDLTSTNALAERLRKETQHRVDTVFDPAAGQYRVLVGEFPDVATAEPIRGDLVSRGYAKEMQIVKRASTSPFPKQIELVDDEGDRSTFTAESVVIMPVTAETLILDGKPYRTAGRVFINTRGLLNVINELGLEDYLRGVVPAELGPRIYDELEAQKAQAIAARTYAVRNLGQYRAEGYDICPGPACQAYKGFSGEEVLSDQAVRETAGLIAVHGGKPIDALYTSTCGGETSDVSTMFPNRNEPYLRRARCVEYETVVLAGRADSPMLSDEAVNARIFAAVASIGEATSWSAREVEASVRAASRAAGITVDAAVAAPRSTRRGDVLTYLGSIWKLETAGRVLTLPEDRRYFFPRTRPEAQSTAHSAAAFLIKYGLIPAQTVEEIDLGVVMSRDELHALLASWLREMSVLQEVTGKIAAVNGRELVLKAEGKRTPFRLPDGIPVFRRLSDRHQEYRELPVMIGDRAFVYLNSQRAPVAVIVQTNYDGASFDRTSNFANWTRSYRADELVTAINRRNPIQQLVDLRPITIDASQRIAEMEVVAEGGRTFMLRGLPIRWSLSVPDNLFVFQKSTDPDGIVRYTFFGKGWGHGTGMCQVGAYGMAFRGWSAERILKNFYTGIEIVPHTLK